MNLKIKIKVEESDAFCCSVSMSKTVKNSNYKGQDRETFLRRRKSFDNRDKNVTKKLTTWTVKVKFLGEILMDKNITGRIA